METYILNPHYRMKQDGNRAILGSIENHSEGDYDENWFSFIHPLQAQMLSFFSEPLPFGNVLKSCASFLKLDISTTKRVLMPFLENEKPFTLRQKNGYHTHFPRKVLIKWDGNVIPPKYSVNDFQIDGTPDFDSYRLCSPIHINMELTMNCYVDCLYCYANRQLRDKSVLTKEEIINFIYTAKEEEVFTLDINGGEVLMHPHIMEILRVMKKCGYTPLISTKMPINVKQIEELQDIGFNFLQISLDSSNPSILHSLIKAKEDYIKKMSETLFNISSRGIGLDINSVITNLNSSEKDLKDLFDFLLPYQTIRRVRINPCGYSLYKPSHYTSLSLSVAQIKAVENFVNKCKSEYPFEIQVSGYEDEQIYSQCDIRAKSFEQRAICTGNLRNAVLLPNGDITICEELYDHPAFVIGNIRTSSLSEIWNSPKALSLYNFSLKKSDSVCHSCQNVKECRTKAGVCWKTVLMAYGMENWDYPDPRCPKAPYPYHKFYAI